jgi:hypothetical protein
MTKIVENKIEDFTESSEENPAHNKGSYVMRGSS